MILVLLMVTGTFVSCITDYDVGILKYRTTECIGINAVLNPENPIQINLFQIKIENNKYVSSGLQGGVVVLKEDESTLYEGVVSDSILITPQSPQVGKSYSIEVSYGGLETVTASTSIPEAIACNVSMELVDNAYGYRKDYLVKLDEFNINTLSKSSLWITAYAISPDNEVAEFQELFCNSALTDKENAEAGVNGVQNKWVGAVYHEFFLRIKNKNTFLLDELLFTPYTYRNLEDDEKLVVQLITANPEYDQYCKTLYHQELIKSYDDALSMMFYQPQEVYCNIEHGLGIFAGINQQTYYFDAK